jgi:hypothetical protein
VTVGFACTSRSDTNKQHRNIPVQWRYVIFEFNDTTIELLKSRDTLYLTTSEGRLRKYPVNKTEKDYLFTQANNLFDFSGQPKAFCTDYISTLEIRIRYNSQLVKEISFTSICDWRELNINTVQIDQLLKKVIAG